MLQIKIYKSVEVDNYENGCQLEGGLDFGCIDTRTFKDAQAVTEFLESYGEVYKFENRFDAQITENKYGYEATKNELEKFKKGEINLYLANYSFFISEIKQLDESELSKLFPQIKGL